MDPRLDLYSHSTVGNFLKHINSSGAVITDSTLPAATQELVKIRASQINGCAGCLDMHTKDAADRGESSVRLNLIAAWREATVFTDAEKIALELTEQGSRLADGGVSLTKPGPTRPSITTMSSLAHWYASSASSISTTASTSSPASPPGTTCPASGVERVTRHPR